jgi:hypothetical protein
MSKISKDTILQSCINGIGKSFSEYLQWSWDDSILIEILKLEMQVQS